MFVLSSGKSGKIHFNLLAKNKRVILTSEAYESMKSAKNGIESVRKNASKRERFEVRTSKNGKPYFVLIARNGEIIGVSQMYAHSSSAYIGIRSVMANAAVSKIEKNIPA